MTKSITKIVKTGSIQIIDKDVNRLVNGRMIQRKKKGRLYSLGGNEPPRRKRGRLDRLKTVGTFDMGIDGPLDESSESIEQNRRKVGDESGGPTHHRHRTRRMSTNAIIGGNGSIDEQPVHYPRTSYTPGPCRREIQKSMFAKRMASRDSRQSVNSATSSPSTRRSHSESDRTSQSTVNQSNQQQLIDDCFEQTRSTNGQSRMCSPTTSTISFKIGTSATTPPRRSPNKYKTFAKKGEGIIKNTASEGIMKKTASEGILKNTAANERIADASDNETVLEKCPYKPRKPVLRKSKRIVRTDSEVFDDIPTNLSPIEVPTTDGSQQITCAQIHNEPEAPSESVIDTNVESIIASEGAVEQPLASEMLDETVDTENIVVVVMDSADKKAADNCDIESTDSTCDLDQLERDYRELARSNLQREYKSDGDSLDEVGRKRSDFQNWKNQSFETNFEMYGKQNSKSRPSQSVDYMEEADKIEVLTRVDSDCGLNNRQYDQNDGIYIGDKNQENNGNVENSSKSDDMSHGTPDQKEQQQQQPQSPPELQPQPQPQQQQQEQQHQTQQLQPIEKTQHLLHEKRDHERPSSILSSGSSAKISSPHKRPSKLDIKADTKIETTSATSTAPNKEKRIFSLLEKRFGKFPKINQLLKLKTTNTAATTHTTNKSTPKKVNENKCAKDSGSSTSTQMSLQAASVGDAAHTNDNEANAVQSNAHTEPQHTSLLKPKCSPGKSSTTDSRSSLHSSKYSLFSSIASKSSIFQKKSASRSSNELNARFSSRTGLTEVSKSNSEIHRSRMSPMRFSMKRTMNKNKPASATCVYTEAKHSPLSEEFYNKTGSVRLSAIELYHKFMLSDFHGLYKQESNSSPARDPSEFRRRYAKGKDAHLMKQKSEPKFVFRQDHDPKEGTWKQFYLRSVRMLSEQISHF